MKSAHNYFSCIVFLSFYAFQSNNRSLALQHHLLKKQIEMFSDLSVVLGRGDLSVTILSYGHAKSNNEEGDVVLHIC